MTRNHDYDTPNEGTIDWHIPLNRNFERIDTDVEIRDTEANIEDYEPKPDAKFLATDSGAVFIGDGSSWNEIGTIGDTEAPDDGGVSNPIGTDVPLWFDDDSNTGLMYNSTNGHVELTVNGRLISQWAENGRERVNGEVVAESMKTAGGGIEITGDSTLDLGGSTPIRGVDHLDFDSGVVEIGEGASANRDYETGGLSRRPIAIGYNAKATQLNCIAIGNDDNGGPTKATADDAMAIGPGAAQATAENAYAIGEDARASGSESAAIGKAATAGGIGAVALGSNTRATSSGASAHSPHSVAIGPDASIGSDANDNSIAIGRESGISGSNSIAIGASARATPAAERAVAIGTGTTVETPGVARVGDGSAADSPDQLVFTAEKDTIADEDLNHGEVTVEMDEANDAFRLRGKDSEGMIREAKIPW